MVSIPGNMTNFLVLLAVVVFVTSKVARFYVEWRFARANGCRKPKAAPRLPFGVDRLWQLLGAMKEFRSLELIRSWYHQYGNTYKTSLGRSMIMTIEPKNVQAILAHKFKDFDLGYNRNQALGPLLGEGIFASDGAIWEHSRALVRPNFVRNQITDIEVYETHVAKLLGHIPRDGSTVDLQDLFFRMTMDSATEFLFGESVDSLDDLSKHSSSFADDFNVSQEGLAIRTRLGPLMLFHKSKAFSKSTRDARHYVDRFVQKAIEYRTLYDAGQAPENTDRRYVFLYELSKKTLDKKTLTDQLLNILLAGRDTTASLLSITFFIMARRPDVWNKLRAEVLKLEGRKPTFEDLKSMTYLTWVLSETLRLHPVVPVNIRTANKDTLLPVGGGPRGDSPVFIPQGQEVFYSVYSMHRLPEVYGPDAAEYRPERWEKLKPGWAYIPFNGGPRICLGQQFALTEAGYTTVRILQTFQFLEARDTAPFTEYLTLTMSSKNGTRVSLTPA